MATNRNTEPLEPDHLCASRLTMEARKHELLAGWAESDDDTSGAEWHRGRAADLRDRAAFARAGEPESRPPRRGSDEEMFEAIPRPVPQFVEVEGIAPQAEQSGAPTVTQGPAAADTEAAVRGLVLAGRAARELRRRERER